MNRTLKNILVVAAVLLSALVLRASPAAATDTSVPAKRYATNGKSAIPGFYVNYPATFAQNDSCESIINMTDLYGATSQGDGTSGMTFIIAANITAAGDSINTAVFGGFTDSGPWVTLYSLANTSTNFTGGTPYKVVSNATAETALPPFPFWKILWKTKGSASLSNKTGFVGYMYPRAKQN